MGTFANTGSPEPADSAAAVVWVGAVPPQNGRGGAEAVAGADVVVGPTDSPAVERFRPVGAVTAWW